MEFRNFGACLEQILAWIDTVRDQVGGGFVGM